MVNISITKKKKKNGNVLGNILKGSILVDSVFLLLTKVLITYYTKTIYLTSITIIVILFKHF